SANAPTYQRPGPLMVTNSRKSRPAGLEHQEILVRQEVVLPGYHVAGAFHLVLYPLRRDARARGRAVRRIHPEIDDRDSAAGLQQFLQLAKAAFSAFDMVIDVHQDDYVGFFWQTGIAGLRGNGSQVLQS